VDGDRALGLMNALLWNSMLVAGPVLIAALVVGLLISVLQVATQLQELIFLGPWMIYRITQFAISMIALIPSLG
jgi:flagellar biosynthetic protein FliQ